MPGSGKPSKAPASHYGDEDSPLHIKGSYIWAPLNSSWLVKKPEEVVRQGFIYELHTKWGYSLDQMRQEARTQVGRGSSRADIVVSKSPEAAANNRDWFMVVETKAENVPINPDDYHQGESYARATGAEYLVMHNSKETSFSRVVLGAPGTRVEIAEIPRADELDNAKRIAEIRNSMKAFTRDEFQRLLFECHTILRDNHKMDPGAAFDEISKILFIKMAYERRGNAELFTTERISTIAAASLLDKDSDQIPNKLFETTKGFYETDQLFSEGDHLLVSLATFKRIVEKLEKFNLSDTGDDVKGIAFERFLGQTFRGELGQFFTPRPLVDFMVEMLDPLEGELICDPASGTGGFLIRAFEYVRSSMEKDLHRKREAATEEVETAAAKEDWSAEKLVKELEKIQTSYDAELDVTNEESRLYQTARYCIHGTDAEPRAARTSKMNMIMHGDGHGGIHYHDGLLDVNGIWEGRFHVILTNPPFGASVGKDQIIGTTEQTRVPEIKNPADYESKYGAGWRAAYDRMAAAAAARLPILQLFEIGRDPIAGDIGSSKVRPSRPTEQLFIERCLNLLEPGGRMGIVLPDGILNNPSLTWLRRYVEGRARLLAVVSVPQEVFASSKATVKTSLVFLRRFTVEQELEWKSALEQGSQEAITALKGQRDEVDVLRRRAETFDRADAAVLIDQISTLSMATPRDSKAITTARTELKSLLSDGDRATAKELASEAATRSRELDRIELEMTWSRARELTTHHVFMAEVENAGITGTGETGPSVLNDLPTVVADYRRFKEDPVAFATEVEARLIDAALAEDED